MVSAENRVEDVPAASSGSAGRSGRPVAGDMPAGEGAFARARRIWKSDGWVKPFFTRYRRVLALSLALGVLTMACASALMFGSGYLISASATRPLDGIFALFVPLAFVQIFGIGKPFLGYFERLRSHDWVLRMTSALRLRLYRAIEGNALFWTARQRTGDVLGLMDQDIGHVQNLYLRCVFPFAVGWSLWLGASLVFGFFSAAFGLGMLLELGVAAVLLPLVSVGVNGARRLRAQAVRGALYARLTDDVLGLDDWAVSGRAGDCLRRAAALQDGADALDAAAARFDRRRDLALHVAMAAAAVAILVWAAGCFGTGPAAAPATDGVARPENWIAAFVLGFFPLIEAFAPLSSAAVEANAHLGAVERLNEVDGTFGHVGPDADDAGAAGEPRAGGDGAARVRREAVAGGPAAVEVREVSFAYDGAARPVLDGLDLALAPGEKVALLGPSGAGKSTLLSLVRGDLVPGSGSVRVMGDDPARLGDAVCARIGVVQQNTYLFAASLLENVRVGNPGATRGQVVRALEDVGLGALVARLPQGVDTPVDEAGMGFSGGERHRVALARVLVADTPVVLLDEPTVGLDPATERALLATMMRTLEGRTVLMATHHLLGAELMDRVVFVEGGRVALEGPPCELAATSRRYRRLLAFDRGLA